MRERENGDLQTPRFSCGREERINERGRREEAEEDRTLGELQRENPKREKMKRDFFEGGRRHLGLLQRAIWTFMCSCILVLETRERSKEASCPATYF